MQQSKASRDNFLQSDQITNNPFSGAWKHCVKVHTGKAGIWDPPVPISACSGDDCGNVPETTTSEDTPSATPQADLNTSTSSSKAAAPASTVAPVVSATPATTATTADPTTPVASETFTAASTASDSTAVESASDEKAVATATPEDSSDDSSTDLPVTTSNTEESTPTVPAVILTSSPTPSAVATLSNSIIISASGSGIVIGSQTLTVGASAVTIPGGEIVSLAPTGVVVSNSDSGVVTTYLIPAVQETSTSTPVHTVSALGSSAAVIADQTINLGGPAVTLSGAEVVSLGSSGIVLQAPSGIITTISVPSSSIAIFQVPAKSEETKSLETSIVPATEVSPIAAAVTPNTKPAATDDIPATSSTSSYASVASTGLGSIIYSTFEGAGQKSTDLKILGGLASAVLGALVFIAL